MAISRLRRIVYGYYALHKRNLPWRRTRNPYHILVSEIMLQQTRVQTVIPYYRRFLRAFPTISVLARAPIGQVLKRWEGLGYYSRARNLHALAKTVAGRQDRRIPRQFEELSNKDKWVGMLPLDNQQAF